MTPDLAILEGIRRSCSLKFVYCTVYRQAICLIFSLLYGYLFQRPYSLIAEATMIYKSAAVLPVGLGLFSIATAQQVGTAIAEVHPKLTTQLCTKSGGCVTRNTAIVTDSLSRNIHVLNDPSRPCDITNRTLCPDPATCSKNCALEGIDYTSIGVQTSGSALTLDFFLANGTGLKATSPRLYLLAEDEKNYEMLKLTNQELTYDVDVSQLACGMNGALYLSEMDMSGSRSDANPAGATYGTGYCDAQCFNDTRFINGLVSHQVIISARWGLCAKAKLCLG